MIVKKPRPLHSESLASAKMAAAPLKPHSAVTANHRPAIVACLSLSATLVEEG